MRTLGKSADFSESENPAEDKLLLIDLFATHHKLTERQTEV
jgi:hypothetical protein